MKTILIALIMLSTLMARADLIDGLIKVESNGNNSAVGDKGKAIGCLQIWAVTVKDVNRIYKTNYTHQDMYDREKAKDVCKKYLLYYGKVYKKQTGKEITAEVLARMWNGGPRGYVKETTKNYWAKVRKEI